MTKEEVIEYLVMSKTSPEDLINDYNEAREVYEETERLKRQEEIDEARFDLVAAMSKYAKVLTGIEFSDKEYKIMAQRFADLENSLTKEKKKVKMNMEDNDLKNLLRLLEQGRP
jgi:hypothetical protein